MKLNNYTPKWWHNKNVEKEILFKDKKILLLSLDKNYEIEKEGQKNLIAVDYRDNIIWIADLPTKVYDSYYEVWQDNEVLLAKSSNSYISKVNPETGDILEKYMIK